MFRATTPETRTRSCFWLASFPMTDTHSGAEPHCLVELVDHTLVVTMNRPEKRNALSGEMLEIMSDAWDRVNSDDAVRVAILTGAGGSFCAGADLAAMSKSAPTDRFESGEFDPSVIKSLLKGFRLTKPLVAAVEGPAIAGGTEILQATDIRVAGESARFGVSEPRWGLYPLGGSAVRLPRQIPYTVAADLLLTGRHIKAPEALALGLVGHVVPDGQALEKAHEIAGLIAANGPLAVQAVLKTIRDSEGKHEDDVLGRRREGRRRRLRLERRQGGPEGVHGEADAGVHRDLSATSAPDPCLQRSVAGRLELHDLAFPERQDVGLVGRLAVDGDPGQDNDPLVVAQEVLRLGGEALLDQLHPEPDDLVLAVVGATDGAVSGDDPLDPAVKRLAGPVDVGRRERRVGSLGALDVLLC